MLKADSRSVPSRPDPTGVEPAPVDLEETMPLGQARSASELLPMRCLRCQGAVERGTAPVRIERNGYRLAWEQVPAWICRRCDLAYFEPREVETIQRALKSMREAPKG